MANEQVSCLFPRARASTESRIRLKPLKERTKRSLLYADKYVRVSFY